jgi:hypothetical protein
VSDQKKKIYAKSVRESNQHRLEEQKRSAHHGQQKNRPIPVPKYQRVGNNLLSFSLTNNQSDLTKPHFLFKHKVRKKNSNAFTYCL